MTNTGIGKILVVDDEVELKNVLVEALASQGYETAGFTSGEDALAAFRTNVFDIILTDLMMPGMDGIALVGEALKIDPHVIVIVMTGQGTIQTAVDAMKVGAFDYVLKPFRLQTVLPALTRAMNTRHTRLENLQLRETVAIYELSQTIAFALDRQTIVSKLADAALQQTDADEVSILFPTEAGDELYVAAVRGENREKLLGERVPLNESISSWVVHERSPLILDGEVNDERFRALWPRPEIRSAISIPMQVANKLIGTININALDRSRPFTLGQVKALTILASTAAAALESASLYQQVQRAEENYRSIFENAVEGIFQSTPEGRFITVNPAMARILGYDSAEEMIEAITDASQQLYVSPADEAAVARLQKDGGKIIGFEFQAPRKDGQTIWLSLNRRSVYDANGREVYREGTIEDITERKRAEEALRSSEAEMRALFASMSDLILVLDSEGRYLKVAPTKTVNVYRAQAAEVGKTIHEVFPKEAADLFLNEIRKALASRSTRRIEYSLTIGDGDFWFDGSVSPMTESTVLWVARDITERKLAEEERARLAAEVESQRQRLDNIMAAVPGVVWEAWGQPDAASQRINFVSDYVESLLGYTVDEWLSTPNFWLTIVHPDDKEQAGAGAAEAYASGQPKTLVFRWLTKDGRSVWVESSFVVIKDDQGHPVGLRGVNTDISERKRAEALEARRAIHALFRADVSAALADSKAPLPDTLKFCAEAMVRHLNAAFARIWTFNAEESVLELQASAGLYTHTHGAHARVPLGSLKVGRIAEERLPQISNDVLNDPEVNDKEWATREGMVAFAGYPLIAEDRLLGVMALFSREALEDDTIDALASIADIVSQGIERQRAEAALRESEERYRDLVENAHDIIYSHDLEGNYTSVNKAGEDITGYTREEALKLNLNDTVAPEWRDKSKDMLRRKLAGERVTAYEMELIAKDGRRVAVEVNSKLVYEKGKPVAVQGIARDVTARKQLEEQLRQSQKMEAIGQLAGGVAHDFNNLLTAIIGYSGLALQRMEADSPLKPYIEEIRKAGDRAANLTRQLLAFGRKQILQPLPLNLNDVITDLNKMLRRMIGEDIRLSARLDPDLKKVKADRGQIEQVLMNLVVNARDAMPRGGSLTIETANIQIEEEYAGRHIGVSSGAYVMLAVSDTGTGMDHETEARIFEPFFTTKEKGKGTGLGLSTVYGIVKQSGGNIWVYSEPGHGTTFKIYLPQVDDQVKTVEAKPEETSIPSGSETVLLVEDEEVVRGLAQRILEDAGYRVITANGGEEAVNWCADHADTIHLLLTDVVMPDTSGKELAERLTSLRPQTKVLFMSGYTDEAIVHHGVLDSNVEFLQKPFTPRALSRKVRQVLDGNGVKLSSGKN
ncbi:MAG TPA: PAS domain S-box protein [Pyrinomonadaceae bacterium]